MSEEQVRIETKILNEVKEMFSDLTSEVTLHMFTKSGHCLLCNETLSLANQVAKQSDKIKLDHCECDITSEKAQKWKIERHPAIVVEGKGKGLVRFYGIPSGYEFGSLIETILLAGQEDRIKLDPSVKEEVEKLEKPVHLQVFVTPTCPYCPRAVLTAFQFAMLNTNIIADMIEATEFQELSMKYRVQGVPKTVVNDDWDIVGAVPERMLLEKVKEAIS